MRDDNSELVYSTEGATLRKKRNERTVPAPVPPHGNVTVRLERKGRGGKSVTVIEGLRIPGKERQSLLRHLKGSLGTGGTIADAVLEIQGDHRDKILVILQKMGFSARRSGG